ncbi:MAG TPA: glycine cleavage system protein GcvH [bacterium]|nr:glycine cleavage system protein GcvH [bacterium]HPN43636.1 glycine cleavage system protein GcvH [bacterium]
MLVPEMLKYTEEHEWVAVNGDIATVGITDYAQGELGDVVFIELPQTNTSLNQMDAFGTIEAVKAVSDLFAPVSGTVIEVNSKLNNAPEFVNKDPYGDGWMIKIKMNAAAELNNLLTAEAYKNKIK